MSTTPFFVFPWQSPFLPELKKYILSQTDHNPGSALIVVPNQRPWKYFSELFKGDHKAYILPKMLAFDEVIQIWRNNIQPARNIASSLDQAAMLYECVLDLAKHNEQLAIYFKDMTMDVFLPWGLKLSSLLEELFTQGRDASDIKYQDDEVEPLAASLLASLGHIAAEWRKLLLSRDFTTPGLDNYIAGKNLDKIPKLLFPGENRQVFIAGFSFLNNTQEHIFKTLWQRGAHICLHADPLLATGKNYHWANTAIHEWESRWQAGFEIVGNAPEHEQTTRQSFFAGYDVHSQLQKLREMATQAGENGESAAIVLANSNLLVPVLHHIPQKNINISMGYPLERSPLSTLIKELLNARKNATDSGKYYWRDLLKIFHQPYLNLLDSSGENIFQFRKAFNSLDKLVRNGEKHVNLDSIVDQCSAALDITSARKLNQCIDILIRNTSAIVSTSTLATYLENVCDFLTVEGGNLWNRFPLDAEAITRLKNNVLPVLRNNLLADIRFSFPAVQWILEYLLERERIPFEAEPLSGLQIMGMLETRLLHFDKLFILDTLEDVLPGIKTSDPLLPDLLRPLAGLPDASSSIQVSAYNFFRLMASAREVNLFWREGLQNSPLYNGKKERSRFIEQIIWQYEQHIGKLLNPGESPLNTAQVHLELDNLPPQDILRTATLNAAMQNKLKGSLSATLIDSYITCPKSFLFKYILNLKEVEEVREGDDPPLVGTCIHQILYDLYKPWLGKNVAINEFTRENVNKAFFAQIKAMNIIKKLPADAYLAFEITGPLRLNNYFKKQPSHTCPIFLEEKINTTFIFNSISYKFTGKIDRIDQRNGGIYILDYKTGRVKNVSFDLWNEDLFFNQLNQCIHDDTQFMRNGDELFGQLRTKITSLQLPIYYLLANDKKYGDIANTSYVDLGDTGEEIPFFPEPEEETDGKIIEEERLFKCRALLGFILKHMKDARSFEAVNDERCNFCLYHRLCHA